MYILVKKFSLRRDNVVYPVGSVVELPAESAHKLAEDAPEEFEIIGEAEALAKPEAVKPASAKKGKKQSTPRSALASEAEPVESDEGVLPAVDEAATVQ